MKDFKAVGKIAKKTQIKRWIAKEIAVCLKFQK